MKKEVKGYTFNKNTNRYNVRFMIKRQMIYGSSYALESEAREAFLKSHAYYTELSKTMEGRL
tara:strand:- start:132 stop:317 length:186 start_codon:yes stop_codon:yes gene_type:complete